MYKSKKPYHYGTGRRKSSVARVHLFPNGTGSIKINGRDIDDYFGLDTLKLIVRYGLPSGLQNSVIALANVVVSEVETHEVIRLGTLSANTARLFHGGQVKPLVVILVDVVVIDRQESCALHVVGVAEEHNLLGVFAHVHRKRGDLAFALGPALVDESHREFGTAGVAIGAVMHFLHDIAAGQCFCAHHDAQGDNNCRGCFCEFHIHIFLLFSKNLEFLD